MQESTESVLDMLFALGVFLLVISFIVTLLHTENEWNSLLTERTNKKASSYYTLAYVEGDNLVNASEAYTDIIAEEASVTIQINGNPVDRNLLEKARNNDMTATRALRTSLQGNYQKRLHYNINEKVEMINFISE